MKEITEDQRYLAAKAHHTVKRLIDAMVASAEMGQKTMMEMREILSHLREHATEDQVAGLLTLVASQEAWLRAVNDMVVYLCMHVLDPSLLEAYLSEGRGVPMNANHMNLSILHGIPATKSDLLACLIDQRGGGDDS